MSRTMILTGLVTLLLVAGLALGTRSGSTPDHPELRSERPNTAGPERFDNALDHKLSARSPDSHALLRGDSQSGPTPGAEHFSANTIETAATRSAMPWLAQDEEEVAAEIAGNMQLTGSPPRSPPMSFSDVQRLYELVPELERDADAPEAPVSLPELLDQPDFEAVPPSVSPGPYFEPAEDETD